MQAKKARVRKASAEIEAYIQTQNNADPGPEDITNAVPGSTSKGSILTFFKPTKFYHTGKKRKFNKK